MEEKPKKKMINWSWGKTPEWREATLVTCRLCKGSGAHKWYPTEPCPTCGGSGKVWERTW